MSPTSGYPAVVSVQSRECSPELMERLSGATLFPERPSGAAVVSVVRRGGGSLFLITAPPLVDADDQVDYFLRLLPEEHEGEVAACRERVVVDGVDDRSSRWLSDKLLDPVNADAAGLRARLAEFVDRERGAGARVSLSCFEPSENLERLGAQLDVPVDQAASRFIPLGTKASSRALFDAAGVPVLPGTGECRTLDELADGIAGLLERGVTRFVLKLSSTEYGAGMGNAVLRLDGARGRADVLAALSGAELVDGKLTWEQFAGAVGRSGILAEQLLEDADLRSPSFQGRIEGEEVRAVSTHDQVLGAMGQTYVGSSFPADGAYREDVVALGLRVGEQLVARGVRGGDYGVDFLTVREAGGWRSYGCELNLRATGTKHGFVMATSLLGVLPDPSGRLVVDGGERVYQASDGITDPSLVGLRPGRLIAAVRESPLHYDPATGTGAVLHMLSPLVEYGKFGAVCIAEDQPTAKRMMVRLKELAVEVGVRESSVDGACVGR
ncbi:peptide ligase PGM1-related protein [Actinosynnema sp. NPDC059797]